MQTFDAPVRDGLPSVRRLLGSIVIAAIAAFVLLGSVDASEAPAATSVASEWRDERRFTLAPGKAIEVKLAMEENARAEYAWQVNGGVVNFDTHAHRGRRSVSYRKGRGAASDQGEIVAAFEGNHGWFWRNRGKSDVELVLRTRGDYDRIVGP